MTTEGFAVTVAGDGALRISGRLTFDTVEAVRAAARIALGSARSSGEVVTFDLDAVEQADSAGLALLVEWRRTALPRRGRIHFRGAPPALRSIAGMCGVADHLFG